MTNWQEKSFILLYDYGVIRLQNDVQPVVVLLLLEQVVHHEKYVVNVQFDCAWLVSVCLKLSGFVPRKSQYQMNNSQFEREVIYSVT